MAIVVAIAILLYLVIGPLLMLLFASFKQTENALPFESGVPFTLNNYADLLLDPSTYPVLLTTAVFVVGSLAIGLAIAIPLAWLFERTNLPLRNAAFALIVGSSGIPAVISAIAWALLFNPTNGIANLWLRGLLGLTGQGPVNIYTVAGLFVIQGITIVPLSILLLGAAFRSMERHSRRQGPPRVRRSARSCGGSPCQCLRRPSWGRWSTSSWWWWSPSTSR